MAVELQPAVAATGSLLYELIPVLVPDRILAFSFAAAAMQSGSERESCESEAVQRAFLRSFRRHIHTPVVFIGHGDTTSK